MKTERAELKRQARQALKGHYGTAIGGYMLYMAIYGLLLMGFYVAVFAMLVAGGFALDQHGFFKYSSEEGVFIAVLILCFLLFMVMIVIIYILMPGLIRLHMNICKGEPASAMDIFWAFRNKPLKFIGISLILFLIAIGLSIPSFVLSFAAAVTDDRTFAALFNLVYTLILYGVSIYASLTFSMLYFILVEDPEKGLIQALKESREMMIGNRVRFFVLSLSFLGWICLGMMSFGIGMLWITPYMSCTVIYFYLDLQPKIETIPPQTAWNPYMEGYRESAGEQVVEENR